MKVEFPDPILVLMLWMPFAVAVAVLKFVLIDPVRAWLEGRHEAIVGERHRAESLEHDAAQRLGEVEARLAQAREEAARLRAEHNARGQQAESAMLAEARQHADGALAEALQQIGAEVKEARGSIAAVSSQLSAEIAGRALGRPVSA